MLEFVSSHSAYTATTKKTSVLCRSISLSEIPFSAIQLPRHLYEENFSMFFPFIFISSVTLHLPDIFVCFVFSILIPISSAHLCRSSTSRLSSLFRELALWQRCHQRIWCYLPVHPCTLFGFSRCFFKYLF